MPTETPTTDSWPYAPSKAVVGIIEGYRKTGFGGLPVTDATIERGGVSKSLIPRTKAALRRLDLIDEEGRPTDQFETLKNAPGDEFLPRLGEWLRSTYAPIFAFCDPSSATAAEVEDAFRGYKPEGQRPRMTSLFLGLCEYAKIIESAPSKPRGRHAQAGTQPKTAAAAKPPTTPPVVPAVSPAKQQYLDMLLERANAQTELDPDLLDRIERALGIAGGNDDA